MVHQAGDGAALPDSAGIRLQLFLSEGVGHREDGSAEACGRSGEKMDHIKTTQADCK